MAAAMCYDCPHRREHEVGDEILSFADEANGPHLCHIRRTSECVGHALALRLRPEGVPFFPAMAGDVVRGTLCTVYTKYGPEGPAQGER